MIVGIHQPNYFPGVSYFAKIISTDVFIFLTSVQYTKGNWTNRNRIKSPQGELLVTVPVLTKGKLNQAISEVRINNKVDWRKKHLKTIAQNYRKAPYFNVYKSLLEEVIGFDTEYLSEFNIHAIKKICSHLGIETEFVLSSELMETNLKRTDLLVYLVQAVEGMAYLSGLGGKKYMEVDKFSKVGIELRYTMFEPVPYRQRYGDFIPNLSILDLLLNEGPNSVSVLKNSSRVEG